MKPTTKENVMTSGVQHIRERGRIIATIGWRRYKNSVFLGIAVPNPKDVATKAFGRKIALGRASTVSRTKKNREATSLNDKASMQYQVDALSKILHSLVARNVFVPITPTEYFRQLDWLAGTIVRSNVPTSCGTP